MEKNIMEKNIINEDIKEIKQYLKENLKIIRDIKEKNIIAMLI